MKKIIVLLFMIMSITAMADINYDIESLKYRKEKSVDLELYFPKKIPDYLDNLLNYNNEEGLYELAKIYFILDKVQIADKYMAEYEKKSKNYLKIAKYYYLKGETEIGDKYINLYITALSIDERLKYFDTIKEIIKKYGVVIDESKIYVSNMELLLTSQSDGKFLEIFTENNWTVEDKNKIALYMCGKDLEKNQKLKEIFYSIADENIKKKYYFDRIKNNYDTEGYFAYFQHGDEGEYKYEIKNIVEKILFLKYKNNTSEFKRVLQIEKETAINEKDYEKLMVLSKIENDGTITDIYNLAMQNEKFCYILIKSIENNESEILKGSQEHNNIINYFIETYPLSVYIEAVYEIKLDMIQDSQQKLILCDEILSKKFVYNIFIKKIKILNDAQRYAESETLGRSYLEKNYPFKECVNEVILAMEKQGKQKEAINLLDSLSEKGYYYEYSEKTKSSISQREKAGLAEYYFDMKNYSKLVVMKEYLGYDKLNYLIESGKIEFKEWAAQKYPFEAKWNDMSKQQYLFFNDKFSQYDENTVKKLEMKKDRNDAEKYYLSRYYSSRNEYQKSIEILEEILPRYRIYTEIIEFYIELLGRKGDNKKSEEISEKYMKLLQWSKN